MGQWADFVFQHGDPYQALEFYLYLYENRPEPDLASRINQFFLAIGCAAPISDWLPRADLGPARFQRQISQIDLPVFAHARAGSLLNYGDVENLLCNPLSQDVPNWKQAVYLVEALVSSPRSSGDRGAMCKKVTAGSIRRPRPERTASFDCEPYRL